MPTAAAIKAFSLDSGAWPKLQLPAVVQTPSPVVSQLLVPPDKLVIFDDRLVAL